MWNFLWLGIFLVLSAAPSWAAFATHCAQRELLKELYRSLYQVLNENAICSQENGQENIELLDLGTPLLYSEFDPGKPSRFSAPGELPTSVLENGLPLVDKVYPTGSARFRLSNNITDSTKDYHFESLSSTYDYILTHMVLTPQNFSDADVLRAKYYLQELVPNYEQVLRKEENLPRFLLYDYYRSNYITVKEKMDDTMESNRLRFTQQKYEEWGREKLSTYESDTEAAYNKWQEFGYKSEVEKQLEYFDIDTHEVKLMSTRALFMSLGRPSERDAHVTVYPYKYEPSSWYKQLHGELPESADELRYKKSLLLTKQALLNATAAELNNITSQEINRRLEVLAEKKAQLMLLVQNGVDRLLQMEVECFTRVNLSMCGEIIEGHAAFREILQEISEHFEHAEYLESILNGRVNTLPVLKQKISSVNQELETLTTKINNADKKEIADDIEASTSSDYEITSCPALGQVKFTFDAQLKEAEINSKCSSHVMECADFRVPVNASMRSLWDVHSCAVDSELKSFNQYQNFTALMNSVPVKVSASLQKVEVKRSWLDSSIFKETNHYTMKKGSGTLSPGPLTPKQFFQRVAHSGQYLLPHYVSGFIVATNIKIFYPGLGSWNSSESTENSNNIIHILMKYAYAQVLTGGVGPFNIETKQNLVHKFQLKRQNGGLLLTIPGGQVIGYILKTMPRFPDKQEEPILAPLNCTTLPVQHSNRKRRSVSEERYPKEMTDMKQLARSLFSEGLRDTSEYVMPLPSSRDIEQLIRKSDIKLDQLSEFIQNVEKMKSNNQPWQNLGSANQTVE